MSSNFKPDGYNSVSPYLVVSSAETTVDFLKTVFDAEELRRYESESGAIVHVEVRVDDTIVMLADQVPPEWSAVSAHVHVYVRDVDAVYQKALEAGAVSIQEPIKKDDADKRGGVKDDGGTTWWIATKVE